MENAAFIYVKGVLISTGYTRVIHGFLGSFVEIPEISFNTSVIEIVPGHEFRFLAVNSNKIFYHLYRTKNSNIKIYHQIKNYPPSDYKAGCYYVRLEDIFTATPLKSVVINNYN